MVAKSSHKNEQQYSLVPTGLVQVGQNGGWDDGQAGPCKGVGAWVYGWWLGGGHVGFIFVRRNFSILKTNQVIMHINSSQKQSFT